MTVCLLNLQVVVGHERLEGRPHTLVHAAGLAPVVDVDVRERADGGRVFIIFGEEPELVRRARAAEAYSHTYFDGRRPRELPQVPAAVLGRETADVI